MTDQPPATTTEEQKRSWFARHKILSTILGVFLFLTIVGALFGEDPEAEPAAQPPSDAAAASEPSEDAEPVEDSEPSAEPAPDPKEPKLSPKEEVQQAVGVVDGATVQEWQRGGKTIVVTFPVSDNLTSGLIKTGMHNDTLAILKAVADTDVPAQDVGVRGTFPLIDKYGNESRGQVVWSYWDQAWEAIDWSKDDIEYLIEVPEAADVYGAHPDFQE